MRDDCKYFQIRAYPSGESVRFCALGLAPEAPWRCPPGCPRFTKAPPGSAPGAGTPGSSGEPELPPTAAELLASADDIISAVGPEIAAEQRRLRQEEERRQSTLWNRLKQRSPRWRR